MEIAFEFIKKNGGITTEDSYPYEGIDGKCDASKDNGVLVTIDGHENVPENDENALLKAVANQPVSVAIDAGSSDFQFYSEVKRKSIKSCCLILEISYLENNIATMLLDLNQRIKKN